MSITFNIYTNKYISIVFGLLIFFYCCISPTISEKLSKIIFNSYLKLLVIFIITINSNSDPILSISIGIIYLLLFRSVVYSKNLVQKTKKFSRDLNFL